MEQREHSGGHEMVDISGSQPLLDECSHLPQTETFYHPPNEHTQSQFYTQAIAQPQGNTKHNNCNI